MERDDKLQRKPVLVQKTCHTALGWVDPVWGPPPKEAAANRGLHEVVGGVANHAKGSSMIYVSSRTGEQIRDTLLSNLLVVEQRAKWPGCTEYLTHSLRRHCSFKYPVLDSSNALSKSYLTCRVRQCFDLSKVMTQPRVGR